MSNHDEAGITLPWAEAMVDQLIKTSSATGEWKATPELAGKMLAGLSVTMPRNTPPPDEFDISDDSVMKASWERDGRRLTIVYSPSADPTCELTSSKEPGGKQIATMPAFHMRYDIQSMFN